MITVLTGENTFEVQRALDDLVAAFAGTPERYDGSELRLEQFPDVLMGATLFSSERLVIVKGLADNSAVWPVLPDWLERVSDTVHLVLVEAKLDKRTTTYKRLKEGADLRDFPLWKEGDTRTAEEWVRTEAAARGIALDSMSIRALVARTGVDQWQLHYALEKLAVLDEVAPAVIERVIEAQPSESVFQVFDLALTGNRAGLRRVLATLAHSEDGFRLFGLLAGQVYQLAALTVSERPSSEVAKQLGVHPYALGKLQPYADRLGRAGVRRIVRRFADADHRLKTGGDDIWTILEVTLMGLRP